MPCETLNTAKAVKSSFLQQQKWEWDKHGNLILRDCNILVWLSNRTLDWQEPTLCQNMPVKATSSLQWNVDNKLAALEEYECGQDDAVKWYLQVCNKRLSALIQLVLGDLSAADRTKIILLITMDVHFDSLIARKNQRPECIFMAETNAPWVRTTSHHWQINATLLWQWLLNCI